MAIIIKVTLKAGEKLICEKCGKEIVEGEISFLDLDLMRESPRTIYCEICKEGEYPWL